MELNKLQTELNKLITSLSRKKDYDSVANLKWIQKRVEQLILINSKLSISDEEKEILINSAFILNKDKLTGSEDFEFAFEKGIKIGVERIIEKLNL